MNEQIEKLEKRNAFLEKELEYYKSELQSTRKILSERDDLLLHLQWDEDDKEIDYDAQKKKRSKERIQTEDKNKIDRLRQQMRIMENAINERDLNINRLNKEMSDMKTQHQQQIDSLKAPREVQRSKTLWGFRSSPSSSPLAYKPNPEGSPASVEPRFNNGSVESPNSSPTAGSPNLAGSSGGYNQHPMSSSSPSMMEIDNKRLQKKSSLFFRSSSFKRSGGSKKTTSPHIQQSTWTQEQVTN
eukprot:gene5134-6394_t